MLIVEHTLETTATRETIWNIWEDVAKWNTWDHGIEYSTLNGSFQVGSTGTVKPKDGPLVYTQLTCVEPLKRFVDEAKLPLTRIIFTHQLSESKGKRIVTTKIEMKGPLAFFFSFVIGRNMKKNLPQDMFRMIQKAEDLS